MLMVSPSQTTRTMFVEVVALQYQQYVVCGVDNRVPQLPQALDPLTRFHHIQLLRYFS